MFLVLLTSHFALTENAADIIMVTGGKTDYNILESCEALGYSQKIPDLPVRVLQHSSFYFEDGLFSCGGQDGTGDTGRARECYKLGPGGWSHHSDLLYLNRESSSVVTGGNVYMVGGNDNPNVVQVLSPGSTTWTAGTDVSVGKVSGGQCGVEIPGNDGKILIIGGYGDGFGSTQVLEFNGVGWESWPDLSSKRWGHACAATDIYVVVAGGYVDGVTRSSVVIEPLTQTYVDGPMMIEPRHWFSLHYINSELWAVGGTYLDHYYYDSSEKSDGGAWEITDQRLLTEKGRFASAIVPYEYLVSVGGDKE